MTLQLAGDEKGSYTLFNLKLNKNKTEFTIKHQHVEQPTPCPLHG